MSFVTVVPSSIKDSVIEDMGRVWCAPRMPGHYTFTLPEDILKGERRT